MPAVLTVNLRKSQKRAKFLSPHLFREVHLSPVTDHDIDSELALEDAQELVDDWVMVLPLDERKQLVVALFCHVSAPAEYGSNTSYSKGRLRFWI